MRFNSSIGLASLLALLFAGPGVRADEALSALCRLIFFDAILSDGWVPPAQ